MKVFVIGDSISVQYGPYLKQYLSGFMDYDRKRGETEALKNLDIPQGANGGDSGMVLEYLRFMKAKEALQADILLVNCGLHDIKISHETGSPQVPLEQYRANLRSLVELAAEMSLELVWMRTTPVDEQVHNKPDRSFFRYEKDAAAYNEAADAIMAEAGITSLDLHRFTVNLGPDVFCDHVHFIEPVREKQAAFIAGWLIAHVAKR